METSASQSECVDTAIPPQHVIIRASAGSGKTHQLSSRYLQLIYAKQPLDRILATTFTRKAAGEILDRVLLRLAKATTSESERDQLCLALQQRVSQERLREMLVELTRNLHRIRISTLDAYFGQVARAFGLELGLPADWTILDAYADQRVRRQAMTELLTRQAQQARELMYLLTKGDAQRAVMSMLLDTVGEVYDLYQESSADGASAWNWFPDLPLATPHEREAALRQFAAAVLPKESHRRAHQAALEHAQAEDWDGFISKGIAKGILHGGKYNRWTITEDVKAVYEPLLETARAHAVHRLAQQTRGAYELARSFDQVYDSLKMQEGAILFGDVPQFLNRLAQRPQREQMAYRMDAQISHLLLDEFQDTSVGQWETLRPMAEWITSFRDESHSFFCVGDTKQAIYGWRGGQADILENLDRQLPNVEVTQLNMSRRSSPVIIDAVNRVFSQRLQHDDLGPYQEGFASWDFPQHHTAKDVSGYVRLEVANADGDGTSDPLFHAAQLVRQLRERAPRHTIGVLVRRNQTVGEVIHQLREQQIPASEEGGNPLTDSAAVQHILALLHFVDHPSDSIARFHFATGPLGGALRISPLELPAEGDVGLELARRLRRELLENGYGASVAVWAEQLGPLCSRRERLRLSQLIDLAYEYQPLATLRPGDFVRYVAAERVADPSTAAVRVMTIHQSKGLEFDIVVLTSLEEAIAKRKNFAVQRGPATLRPQRICRYAGEEIRSLLPPEMQQLFAEDVRRDTHEYLCGLYVAMTRAKRALYMILEPYSGKKYRKSTAGLLQATLGTETIAKAGSVVFEAGEREWYRAKAIDDAAANSLPQPTRKSRQSVRLKNQQPGSGGPLPKSPSGRSHDMPGAVELFSKQRQKAIDFGILMHMWLEEVAWLEALPTIGQLREIARGRFPGELDEAAAEFLGVLATPAVRGLLELEPYSREFHEWLAGRVGLANSSPAFSRVRLEVRNEQRIAYRDQGQPVTGSIDRLVLAYDGISIVAADVLDWKSDRLATANRTQRREQIASYEPQLIAYRQAVHSMFGLTDDRIRTRLVFLRAGAVVEIVPSIDTTAT